MKKSGFAASFALAVGCVLSGCGGQQPAVHVSAEAIYAGISPDTNKPFYTTPADAPGTYTWDEAKAFCATEGGRLPTMHELNVLFQKRAIIGGFNVAAVDAADSNAGGNYWSSSPYGDDYKWMQSFDFGVQTFDSRDYTALVRCVLE